MATTSGNTEMTGSLTDKDSSGRKSRMQTSASGGSRASFSDSISALHDSVPSLSLEPGGRQGPNDSARPLRLGQSLASFSEWGSDNVVDASSSTLGDGSGGLLRTSMMSITGASKRASARSRGRSSITLNKLKTANLGIVGRDGEKALIRDAYARVAGTQQLGQGGSKKAGGSTKDIDGVTDNTSLSSSSLYSAATSSAKTKDSLSEHVKGRAQEAQAGPSGAAGDDEHGDDGVPMPSNGQELVLISGHSGTGKTALVEDALTYKSQSSKRRAKMIYLKGKFDLKQHQQPYAGFVSAFEDLPDELNGLGKAAGGVKDGIIEAVGEDSTLLTQLVPDLRAILGASAAVDDDSDSDSDADSDGVEVSMEAKNRLLFIFKRFMASIGGGGVPFVLFLDDLQFADADSLGLLESMVTDHDTGGSILIVGTYRDNEVDEEHPLAQTIERIKSSERKQTYIALGDLGSDDVNALVADVLQQQKEKVTSLSDVVKEKTLGNPFHIISFLSALEREELLTFNFGTFKWTWDVEKINKKYVTANVTDLMEQKLQALALEAQMILQVASCLGCEFSWNTLQLASNAFPRAFNELALEKYKTLPLCLEGVLSHSVEEGVLRRVDPTTYCFVHDQIQAAAFNLVVEEDRQLLQAKIGKSIVDQASPDELDGILLLAVDLCNSDPSLFTSSPQDKEHFAQLNLRAGKQAVQNSAFSYAAAYFMSGIGALDNLPFEDNCQLYVDLYGLASQAHYCKGDSDKMNECLDAVLSLGNLTVEESFPLQMTRCKSLYVRHQYDEALALGQKMLKDIGYKPFPKKAPMPFVIKEFMKTKLLLKKYDGKFLDLPLMTDKNRLRALKVFKALCILTFQHGDPIMPVVVWRWLRWSLKYGLSDIGCVAFATHGIILVSMGDLKGGFEIAKITEQLLERLKPMDQMAYALMCTDNFVKAWTVPVQKLVAPCVKNCEIGLKTGDNEAAMWHVFYAGCFSWIAGNKNLIYMEDLLGQYCETIQFYQQDAIYNCLVPHRQMVLNLLGYADDPLTLTGIAMDEDQFLKEATACGHQTAVNVVHSQRLELAYYFGRYNLASEILDDIKPWETVAPAYVGIYRAALFQGLTCFAMADIENHHRRKWIKRGSAFMNQIQKWVKAGNVNTLHMLHLLRAEQARVQGKAAVAEKEYGEAIATSSRNGFIHDRALAHERFMQYYLKKSEDTYWTRHHYDKALQALTDWGATALADRLTIANENRL